VFFPIAASRSEDDSTPKEESKAEDTAAASVNVNAIWRDLGVREDSFGAFSKGREDMCVPFCLAAAVHALMVGRVNVVRWWFCVW